MVDDEFICAVLREAVPAEVADALREARVVRHEHQVRPIVDDQLAGVGEAQHAVHDKDALRVDLQIAGDEVQQRRSEEHTSELQSLMRISYAVYCLKNKT